MRTYKHQYSCECAFGCSIISDQAYEAFWRANNIESVTNPGLRILSNKCSNLKNELVLRKGKECTIVEA